MRKVEAARRRLIRVAVYFTPEDKLLWEQVAANNAQNLSGFARFCMKWWAIAHGELAPTYQFAPEKPLPAEVSHAELP